MSNFDRCLRVNGLKYAEGCSQCTAGGLTSYPQIGASITRVRIRSVVQLHWRRCATLAGAASGSRNWG